MADTDDIVRYYDQTWFDYRLLWTRNHHMHFGFWDATTRNQAESLAAMTRATADGNVRPGERILDAGCGVGGPALWLARHYDAEVVGVSLSDAQIAKAREHADREGLADMVRFERADFTATAFADASFDVVWAQESVCHVPADAKKAFLAEAERVLRPGGRLVMEDWFRPATIERDADAALLQDWLDKWAISGLATVAEFRAWAEAAGFTDFCHRDLTVGARPSLRRLYALSLACYPVGVALRALRLRSATQHANMQGGRLQWHAHRRGLWSIRAVSARKPDAQTAGHHPEGQGTS